MRLIPGKTERGFSYLEILIVAGLIIIILEIIFLYYRRQIRTVEKDQALSAYYISLGNFLQKFQTDVRMARKLEIASPTYILDVRTLKGPRKITYTVLPNDKIERECNGRKEIFSFSKPPKTAGKFVFEIKEVKK